MIIMIDSPPMGDEWVRVKSVVTPCFLSYATLRLRLEDLEVLLEIDNAIEGRRFPRSSKPGNPWVAPYICWPRMQDQKCRAQTQRNFSTIWIILTGDNIDGDNVDRDIDRPFYHAHSKPLSKPYSRPVSKPVVSKSTQSKPRHKKRTRHSNPYDLRLLV